MDNDRSLDALLNQGKEALKRLEAIEILAETLKADVKTLARYVLGNGKRGLLIRVDDLEEFQAEYEEEQKEKRRDQKKLRYALYTAIFVLIINLAWNLFGDGFKSNIGTIKMQEIERKEKLLDEKLDKVIEKLDEAEGK